MDEIPDQIGSYYTWCKTKYDHVFLETFIHALNPVMPWQSITWSDLQNMGYTTYTIQGPTGIITAIRNRQIDRRVNQDFDEIVEHIPEHTPVIRPRGRFGKLNFKTKE